MDMELEYAAGVIAGEGCFMLKLSEELTGPVGIGISPSMSVNMDDRDVDLLEYLRDVFGSGNLYNSGTGTMWSIEGWENCSEVVDKLESVKCRGWEESNKYDTFVEWSGIVQNYEPPSTTEEADRYIEASKRLNNSELGLSVDEWKKRARYEHVENPW